jgi:formylglycine-generating enzyme required for sulfatase activity/DNA-directed RNA polymerase subunit E'/Rpb7
MNGNPKTTNLDRGELMVRLFLDRFDESYREMAEYAALPFVLTPELVNYLHSEFLRHSAPGYEAGADLLLSDLCNAVGYEQYVMRRDAREYLLAEMKRRHGPETMQKAARKLLGYVVHLARTTYAMRKDELKAQEWAAMLFLDDQRQTAVREIAQEIRSCFFAEEAEIAGDSGDANLSELGRLSRLVADFAPQLDRYPELVEYGLMAGQILADASGETTVELIKREKLSQPLIVVDVELPSLSALIPAVQPKLVGEMIARAQAQKPAERKLGTTKRARAEAEAALLIPGEVISGKVERITQLFQAFVDLGDKGTGLALPTGIPSEVIPLELVTASFDWVVIWPRNNDGLVAISQIAANRPTSWEEIEKAYQTGADVIGRVDRMARDGLWVSLGEVEAFLPNDEFDLRRPRNLRDFAGKEIVARVTEFSRHSRVRLSRKSVIEDERARCKRLLFENLEPDFVVTGLVRHLTDYGAFIDLGGFDGLLHISEMSWRRQFQPAELFKVGDLIDVKILKIDRDRERISLTYRPLSPNPWDTVPERYRIGQKVKGTVTSVAVFGAFVELEPGVEGLIHVSDISWTENPGDATKVLQKGQEVEAAVILIDIELFRIGLSIKNLTEKPGQKRQAADSQPAVQPITLTTFDFDTVTLDETGEAIERRRLSARQFVEELAPSVNLEMVEIPGGKFLMGAPKKEQDSYDNERPQREVNISPFYIGKFTITQKQWRVVAGWEMIERELNPDPSHFKGDNRPVENISWHDAREFCARLAKKTGRGYRLPTEAEWEYACRAGTTTPFAFGETITPEIVNYDGNHPYAKAERGVYRGETIPVGSLGVANAFGLFDMHGNVWEWCEDVWHDSYQGAPIDGSAWLSGGDSSYCSLRGGSWYGDADVCRSAFRDVNRSDTRDVDIGLRVVVGARTP